MRGPIVDRYYIELLVFGDGSTIWLVYLELQEILDYGMYKVEVPVAVSKGSRSRLLQIGAEKETKRTNDYSGKHESTAKVGKLEWVIFVKNVILAVKVCRIVVPIHAIRKDTHTALRSSFREEKLSEQQ